ncbi:hypothetical protein HELRODRAFT_188636 [Helobdella robusta]|uniref:Tetraspanin n=1 Tax=Helobdella robusta TaxID=6412 RepID=T1FQ73_HELRO|nr:hypothetical protein HELRODRAFT_188636 [Helobdella robusta]ESO02256.1 hypothetical protein HELRODRAFT_188636 [Helobdella robusta]
MAATCGANFAKIVLIIFNIIFFCAGVVLIAVGIWIIADPNIIEPIKIFRDAFGARFLRNASILLITMGVVVLLVTGLGIFAAIKENVIALSVYIGLLCFVCCGEIAGGVVAIVFKDKAIEQVQTSIGQLLVEQAFATNFTYYSVTSGKCWVGEWPKLVDYLQIKFECCGMDSYQDYKDVFQFNTTYTCGINDTAGYSESVPVSCCLPRPQQTPLDVYSDIYALTTRVNCTTGYYGKGCTAKLISFIERYAPVIIGIGLGFGFLELFGIIFAVCLCQNPKDY